MNTNNDVNGTNNIDNININIIGNMNKCNSCKVSVYPQHGVCPLCGKQLEKPIQSETSYPEYAINRNGVGFAGLTVKKLLLFSTIIASAVSVFINIFTLDKLDNINKIDDILKLWSVIVCASLISLWLIIRIILEKKVSVGRKIIYDYGVVSAYLIVLDICSGFSKWSTTYVIPFLTVAVAVVFTSIAISNNKNFREYLGVLIAVFFISFCPIIIYVFSLSTQAWTSFVAILYCLLTMTGLIIFSGGSFKHEMKKRFHF